MALRPKRLSPIRTTTSGFLVLVLLLVLLLFGAAACAYAQVSTTLELGGVVAARSSLSFIPSAADGPAVASFEGMLSDSSAPGARYSVVMEVPAAMSAPVNDSAVRVDGASGAWRVEVDGRFARFSAGRALLCRSISPRGVTQVRLHTLHADAPSGPDSASGQQTTVFISIIAK